MGLNYQRQKCGQRTCDFRAYEVFTNFRRGLLQRDDEPEFSC